MSGRITAKWHRRIGALKEWWASILGNEREPQGERQERRVYANDQKIIAALERIADQAEANAKRHESEELRSTTWERRRFCLEVAAVLAAFWGADILLDTLHEAHQGTIDANRAWISTEDIQPNGGFSAGGPIRYILPHNNVGKSPAVNIELNIDNGFVPAPENLNFSKLTFSQIDMCSLESGWVKSGAIFPTRGSAMRLTSTTIRKEIVAKADMKSSLFYSRGCIRYKTMGIEGKTRFCSILSPRINQQTGVVTDFESVKCPNGNDAE